MFIAKNKLKEFEESETPDKYGVKDHCAWCGVKIEISWARFVSRGNACEHCQSRFARVFSKEITTSQADQELRDRIYFLREAQA